MDVTYAFSMEAFGILERPASALPRRGVPARLVAMVAHWLQARRATREYKTVPARKGGIVFFANTRNQHHAITPIASLLPGASVFGEFGIGDQPFPTPMAYRQSLPWIAPVWFASRSAAPYVRRSMHYFFDQFVLAHGYLEAARIWLDQVAPSVLVLANDHNLQHRALVRAARDAAVPTVYLQHAAVTQRFPPLAMDFALLDGEDALEKYARCGTSATQVYITGSAKADLLLEKRRGRSGSAIGICTNRLDDPAAVERVCRVLRQEFPEETLILRLHPSDMRRAKWSAVAERNGLCLGAAGQPVDDFLGGVGVVVSGGSSILLEAALAGAAAVSFGFNPEVGDVYGFAASGIVPHASNTEDLVRLIRARKGRAAPETALLRRFHATYGTPLHGSSAKLSAQVIRDIASGAGGPFPGWERVKDTPLIAFRPNLAHAMSGSNLAPGRATISHAQGVGE